MKKAVIRLAFVSALALAFLSVNSALALENPQSGSIGLETTISTAPPTLPAGVSVPRNGASFTTTPITVSGTCTGQVLVKVFANNIFVGSVPCKNGSYSLQIDLFSGTNQIVARVYDALDQAGPDSNTVVVTLDNAQLETAANKIFLTSNYALRGAAPNTELTWPLALSGGQGPYAVSVDWGDGSPADLVGLETAGNFDIKHTYKTAGLYKIVIQAGDKGGDKAFLQLTGQATGALQSVAKTQAVNNAAAKKGGGWWAGLAVLPLIGAAFWAGQRHQAVNQRRKFQQGDF